MVLWFAVLITLIKSVLSCSISPWEKRTKKNYGNADPTKLLKSAGEEGIEAGDDSGFDHQIILDRFISFLSGRPSYIDTSVCGEIIITLDLTPASECLFRSEVSDANATSEPSCTLSDIYSTVPKVQINDGFYYSALQSALAAGLPFKMMFHHFDFTTSSQAGNQTMSMRTEVQSDSVDLAFFSFMLHSSASKQTNSNTDVKYLEDTNSHAYLKRSLEDVTQLTFNINGQNFPNYAMNKGDIWNQLLNDLGVANDRDGSMYDLIMTNATNQSKYFGVATCALHHPTAEGSLISGLSSEGTPFQISVDVQSSEASSEQWIGCLTVMTTRVIEVYAGRNLILIRWAYDKIISFFFSFI